MIFNQGGTLDGKEEYDNDIKHLINVIDNIVLADVINTKAGFKEDQTRGPGGKWSKTGGSNKINTKTVLDYHNKEGGSTYGMDGINKAGAEGMGSVSVYTSPPESLVLEGKLTEQDLSDFLEANKALLKNSSKFGLGSWYSTKSNVTFLDVVTIIKLKDAIKLGVANNQQAIFDLENMVEISTGGTGIDEKKSQDMNKEKWGAYGKYLEATKPAERKITSRAELAQMAKNAQSKKK